MFKKILSSEDGFGIIQALAGLMIVTIALTGLFLSSYYAWHSAIGNYHYRVVLLKAHQKLEEVKYLNRYNEGVTYTNSITSGNFLIDDENEEPVYGLIYPPTISTTTDLAVSQYVDYDKISIKITWRDGPEYFLNSILNKERTLILREDYFYRTKDEE
ncbi:MAG: hypothetical protein HOK80_10035 [Candidatus Cloacimonetes bacterium]|jgi:hypothetical protein|nr:hypothetical protein [Candidatus Cloacimonadota bacterium]MBT4332938.1 hypothetical protein [Candidatus Cloacimonadota bacterium]MBT5421217.1 hypothetical protein [Candidatus Cloacimonadota bacterium]